MRRWSSFVVARPRTVLAVVLVLVAIAGVWGAGVFSRLSLGGYTDPGSESAQVEQIVDEHFGRQTPDLVVVYTARAGESLDELGPAVAARVDALDPTLLAGEPMSYWSAPPPAAPFLRSTDGERGMLVLPLAGDESSRIADVGQFEDALRIDGVDTEFSGFSVVADAYNSISESDLVTAESVSFPILMVLLLVIFGSVVGAAVPLCIGGMAIVVSLGMLRVLSHFTEVSGFAVNIASLVGLGMSIDYGLFVVTRFREELRSGSSPADALHRTLATAGRTVGFSALLLGCGFLGMLVFPQALVRSFAYGGMFAVLIAAALALSALPAALALLGRRIDALSWRRGVVDRSEARAVRFWGGVASTVMRRPVAVATAVTAVLVFLALPLGSASLGDLDHTGLPAGHPARTAVDDIARDFPMSNNGATLLLQGADGAPPTPEQNLRFSSALDRVDGVSRVLPVGTAEDFTVVRAVLDGADRSAEALAAVERLRVMPVPEGTTLRIGGLNAATIDGVDAMGSRLPWMIATMIAATCVAMFAAFRSVLLPVKAVAMAALSLAATFGILTWIFEQGHGAHLLGVDPGPLPGAMVLLIVAVVFGLSTDYEIFLLSRMSEAHRRGASTRDAVREGIARTGRIVTAAAALLVVVTGAFTLSDLTMMRFIGVGMIVALVIDTTLVRMLLVPALVALMGEANWWAPRWARASTTPPRASDPDPEHAVSQSNTAAVD
ncbi:MMPL family transporter [Rhodococcus sp. HNM0569]|uniref:MMPL family transporter n=1 Tax=Rhodococcus sp. HNM0569 TaxID=2716340 RepID=UPI00146E85AB|nr:MMPL family transporter [Rhodococcus sp. HNM0569]NLU84207.1 MMPL family transporter [Rhodococcus sp. HNM0569]